MWELAQQIRQLLASTGLTQEQVADAISTESRRVYHSQLSRALTQREPSPAQIRILMAAHEYLTGAQEQMNKKVQSQIKRASKALEEAV